MTISERVKALRKQTGLTQQKFGDMFGIPLRTIQDWEYNKHLPPEYVVNMMETIVDLIHDDE